MLHYYGSATDSLLHLVDYIFSCWARTTTVHIWRMNERNDHEETDILFFVKISRAYHSTVVLSLVGFKNGPMKKRTKSDDHDQ